MSDLTETEREELERDFYHEADHPPYLATVERILAARRDAETIRGLRRERDAYRKAKQENDERFQLEAGEWRRRYERLRGDVEALADQAEEFYTPSLRVRAVHEDRLRAILARPPHGDSREGDGRPSDHHERPEGEGATRPACLRCEVPIYLDGTTWRREATGSEKCPRNPAGDGHEPLRPEGEAVGVRPHDRRGDLDRSLCGECGGAFIECVRCKVFACECSSDCRVEQINEHDLAPSDVLGDYVEWVRCGCGVDIDPRDPDHRQHIWRGADR